MSNHKLFRCCYYRRRRRRYDYENEEGHVVDRESLFVYYHHKDW